jgi:hypothetical protein
MLLAQREPRTPAPKVLTTSEKLCVFCEHMEFDDGGTGEYADPATMTCAKGRWSGHKRTVWNGAVMLFSSDDLSSFREVILMAKDCPDYKPPK